MNQQKLEGIITGIIATTIVVATIGTLGGVMVTATTSKQEKETQRFTTKIYKLEDTYESMLSTTSPTEAITTYKRQLDRLVDAHINTLKTIK